ncbi:O-antigen ligase family protein [Parasalinivibrio latis]|uniref:O-antigen ligase family protein n=1 Tax=Parasalinivibrio latis TaxID=2952610 RepID=UPI0030E06C2B
MNSLGEPIRHQIILILFVCFAVAFAWFVIPKPYLIILISTAPIALVMVLAKPFPMVLFFVIFSFFRIHEVFPQLYNLKIPLLLSLASLGAIAWHTLISGKIKVYWRPEFTLLTIFTLLVIIGVVLANNRPIAIAYFKDIYWKIIVMTFAIAWLCRTEKDFRLSSGLILFAGLVVGTKAIINKVTGVGLVEGTRVTIGRELGSMLGDPNDLSLVLMFPTSFALGIALTKSMNRFYRAIAFISVPILFYAVIATQSRGGLLGILAVFGVFAYQRIKSKALLITLGVMAAGILFALAGISDRASGGSGEAGIDASAMGRIYAWQAAFGMAVSHPLTGVGLDNFYANYFYYSPHWDGLNHAVHSTWFGVLAESGFVGLGIFVALILVLINTARNSLKTILLSPDKYPPVVLASSQAVFAGLIGTIVSGTFLTQGYNWPIYILAALVAAVGQYIDTTTPAQESKK